MISMGSLSVRLRFIAYLLIYYFQENLQANLNEVQALFSKLFNLVSNSSSFNVAFICGPMKYCLIFGLLNR